ncbi:DUF2059 domain-containing protein [Rhodoblastus acidophilus]|uniref:DUF2059 domain-containing protein n=1 Tax=Rhodoblastus acidophilus TaxID=1074 RepID=A0A6N8DRB9_RHOAC|nr:DUF2059 domain-containing protein [Rhodoblastus acidophilus]MCW2275388.1 hypothetical protein [Rhodoblastus acidophilus]MTV31721.1 DUF2059 domain-containing protein [Rhodoblastus acidophilus]
MMRRPASLLVLMALALCGAASAQDSAQGYAGKLKAYDPQAVEAAQAYAKTLDLRALVTKSAPFAAQQVNQRLRAANPGLGEDQASAFVDHFVEKMLTQDVDAIERASVLTLLETMDKDELEALRAFQQTPMGAKVVRKMPLLVARLNENMRLMNDFVIPRALAAARDEMLKAGVEVKI